MTANPVANSFAAGAASVAGMATMAVALSNPQATAIIATTGVAYQYADDPEFRERANDRVYTIASNVAEYVGEPDNPNNKENRANRISNFSTLGGIAATAVTGNPLFMYTGLALASAAQIVRGVVQYLNGEKE